MSVIETACESNSRQRLRLCPSPICAVSHRCWAISQRSSRRQQPKSAVPYWYSSLTRCTSDTTLSSQFDRRCEHGRFYKRYTSNLYKLSIGGPGGDRTHDTRLKRPLLYH